MFLTEGSNFTRMKNKYLTRSLCVTILSAMVLSSPMSVMAADEHIETASDLGDGSGEVISVNQIRRTGMSVISEFQWKGGLHKLLYICPQTGKGTSFSNGIPAPI